MENFFKLCKERLDIQSKMHEIGQCIMWIGCTKKGYGQFRYRDPRDPDTVGHRTRSVHRMALMVKVMCLDVPPEQQASHLCNNKLCINTDHIVFEDNYTNNNRKTCFSNAKCSGHHGKNDIQRPDCLIGLNDLSER